jgi:phospholipid/cholesterol/gamma-HCH transport system permease protein
MSNKNIKKYIFTKVLDEYFTGISKAWCFTSLFFTEVRKKPFHLREVINQCFEVGLKSLALITLTGFIVGIVFTKQSRPSLKNLGPRRGCLP